MPSSPAAAAKRWFSGAVRRISSPSSAGIAKATLLRSDNGIVALCESALKGAGYSLLPKDTDYFSEKPGSYCHILLPTNREAIDCVVGYLTADNALSDNYFE